MSDTPTTGLRDLPLSQYLLRGRRSILRAARTETFSRHPVGL